MMAIARVREEQPYDAAARAPARACIASEQLFNCVTQASNSARTYQAGRHLQHDCLFQGLLRQLQLLLLQIDIGQFLPRLRILTQSVPSDSTRRGFARANAARTACLHGSGQGRDSRRTCGNMSRYSFMARAAAAMSSGAPPSFRTQTILFLAAALKGSSCHHPTTIRGHAPAQLRKELDSAPWAGHVRAYDRRAVGEGEAQSDDEEGAR